jgi:hypothetical protein
MSVILALEATASGCPPDAWLALGALSAPAVFSPGFVVGPGDGGEVVPGRGQPASSAARAIQHPDVRALVMP